MIFGTKITVVASIYEEQSVDQKIVMYLTGPSPIIGLRLKGNQHLSPAVSGECVYIRRSLKAMGSYLEMGGE